MFNNGYLLRTAVFLSIAYLTAFFYTSHSHEWSVLGRGLSTFNPKIFWIEFPLFVLLSSLFYFPSVKNWLIRNSLPLIPTLILYILFDAFYNFFGRTATPSDFQNITEIFSFSLTLGISLLAIYLIIPISIFLSIKFNKNFSLIELRQSLLVRLGLSMFAILLILSPITKSFQEAFFNYTVWAQEDTIRENGRFNSAIFYALQEMNYSTLLKNYSTEKENINTIEQLYPGSVKTAKNIHMIVMESFIDPRLIEELDLSSSFVAPELLEYLVDEKYFSHVTSPVYAGGTAQVEFELLTGIKALSKVNQIEFNTMQGSELNAFVKALKNNNYLINSTIAPSSEFFNSKRAYQSLGFERTIYLQETKFINADSPIFDGDLFDYNIEFLKKYFKVEKKPIFNYVLGMYGHFPFDRNLKLRPNVIEPNHTDDRLNRITNQFYYRTKALAKYISQLIEIDSNAIILVASDHLPSVLSSDAHYVSVNQSTGEMDIKNNHKLREKLNNKINIALMIDSGKAINITGKSYYQIPWLIWDMISSKPKQPLGTREISSENMLALYFTALSEAQKK